MSISKRASWFSRKRIILIAAVVLVLLLIALLVINYSSRGYWYYKKDGTCYIKFKNYVQQTMDVCAYGPEPYPVFDSIAELKASILQGTKIQDKMLQISTSGVCSEDGQWQVFDIAKLDDFSVPGDISVTKVELCPNYFQIVYGQESSASCYRAQFMHTNTLSQYTLECFNPGLTGALPSYDKQRKVNVYYADPQDTASPKKTVQYNLEDGEHSYSVREVYDSKEAEIPQKVEILYYNTKSDFYVVLHTFGSQIPTEEWITTFRYDPSFLEGLFQ